MLPAVAPDPFISMVVLALRVKLSAPLPTLRRMGAETTIEPT